MWRIAFSHHAQFLCRRLMIAGIVMTLLEGLTVYSAYAAQNDERPSTVTVLSLSIQGLVRTNDETIRRLLPRQIPAQFTPAELLEFERRIRNLNLFDRVSVTKRGDSVFVDVQEKFTLSPVLSFTSGTSVKDFNATAGLVEYNVGGTGTQLGGQFNYSQRGPNVDLWISEHAYRPDRWAKEMKASYNVNGIRFADSTAAWTRNRVGGELELKGPFTYGSALRYEVVAKFYRESVQNQIGAHTPDGYYAGLIPEATWDRYHWHDLVPWGYRIALELRPGYFLGTNQARHELRLRYLQGIPLASTTVFMINGVAEAVNRSRNPNHSLLIGSIAGIRGLSDNLYRTRAQTYMNLELRHAIQLAPRWALQGVLFSDFGGFQPFTQEGNQRDWIGTVNIGAGIRVVPTFLTNTLLRVDCAQLLSPSPNSLVQVGITQYF
ncbi:MAG: hypothetical protein OJF47_003633 [Nitrospira sp.]|jgi:hypothetical protein|nr:MAG: hypothetical protein OJF47_003633 [Nitrospira sp.]